jgi:hypothetical protein
VTRSGQMSAFAAAALAIFSFPAFAGTEMRETTAFKVEVPTGWELQVKEPPSMGGKLGSWVFVSPTRDKRMFIRVGKLRQGKLAEQWNAFVGERLGQTLRHIKAQDYREKTMGTTEIAIGHIYGVGRRNKTGQLYKYAVLLVRDSSRQRAAYVAIGATQAHWGEALARFDRVLKTLDLK